MMKAWYLSLSIIVVFQNGSRRRTPGGVYLMLLKNDTEVTKEQMDEIFEEENRWSMEMKKRKKARCVNGFLCSLCFFSFL